MAKGVMRMKNMVTHNEESIRASLKKIGVFLALTLAFSSIFWVLILFHIGTAASYDPLLMWCPGIAAFLTLFFFQKNVGHLLRRWSKPPYLLVGYLLPLVYGLITYGVIWVSGWGALTVQNAIRVLQLQGMPVQDQPAGVIIGLFALYAAVMSVVGVLTAAGEEIGWRGVLVPELAKIMSFGPTALLSGFIWAIWHYPLIFFGGYSGNTSLWYSLLCFTILAMALGVVSAWLRLRSGSIWPSILLHASHNAWILVFFSPLTANMGLTPYLIGEFGIGLAVTTVVCALVFWSKRAEVSARLSHAPAV